MRVLVIASSTKRSCANGKSRLTVMTTVPAGMRAIASLTWCVCDSQTRVSIDGTTDSTSVLPRKSAMWTGASLESCSVASGADCPTSTVRPTRVSGLSPRRMTSVRVGGRVGFDEHATRAATRRTAKRMRKL
jgi:hypothetical protein